MKVFIRRVDESMGTDTNGEGISLNIFFAGCRKQPKCRNCHNPDLWVQKEEDVMTLEHLCRGLLTECVNNGLITHIVFVGGEPLDQPKALFHAANYAKSLGLTTWLYTGYPYNYVPTNIKGVMDVVVAGEYIDELKTGGFPGSSNQKVIRRRQ
jgi:anaerobic ribonucleoside-triphosphate reductase activating protein